MRAPENNNPTSVLLAIDIGNTNVSMAAFEGANMRAPWRISTNRHRMADEYRPLMGGLLEAAGLSFQMVESVVMASVVPPVQQELSEAFEREGLDVVVLRGAHFGLEVRYDPPGSVGADRLANALAAEQKYGRPVIIVDLGTATTLDVLDSTGAYIGGAIAPGIEISTEAMFETAFQLPRLRLEAPARAIGRTTVESIRSGAVLGWASLVDGLIERISSEIDGRPTVVGTGGLAPLIAPHSQHMATVDQNLTLEGLRLAYERVSHKGEI